ncbi:unnamed protein product [Lupinus luteus]|uniref:Uncharacterized protein n=1 Tax=Lupinus luteus TaxID=3873 RepID=A0AAV1WVH3_LUPLU
MSAQIPIRGGSVFARSIRSMREEVDDRLVDYIMMDNKKSDPWVEHHASGTSKAEFKRINAQEASTSQRNMDVNTLMDHLQALVTAQSENVMGRLIEHEDNLYVRLDTMYIVIYFGLEDIHTRLSSLEGNFSPCDLDDEEEDFDDFSAFDHSASHKKEDKHIVILKERNFTIIVEKNRFVMLVFNAPWCEMQKCAGLGRR